MNRNVSEIGNVLRRSPLAAAAALAFVLASSGASAQLDPATQHCIDGYNNALRLIGQQAGTDFRTCIKKSGKGSLPYSADDCVAYDQPGKIRAKILKLAALYSSEKCSGAEPIQQGTTHGYFPVIGASRDLVRDVFGTPVSGVTTPGKEVAACQERVYRRTAQLFTEEMKAFRACKKAGMKSGTVIDSASLQAACMTPSIPDPAQKISKRLSVLEADAAAKCASVTLAAAFPGVCSSSAGTGALADCIGRQARCRLCLALDHADGMGRDCDDFDDGIANTSCTAVCGDGMADGSEQCDGVEDAACPDNCAADCTCAACPVTGGDPVVCATADALCTSCLNSSTSEAGALCAAAADVGSCSDTAMNDDCNAAANAAGCANECCP